jgi:hypothetical protein
MKEEISTKTNSLKRQIRRHFHDIWLPSRFENIKSENVPDSFQPYPLDRFLSVTTTDFVFDGFEPPFPFQRNRAEYSGEVLDGVIFPWFLEYSRSSIEIVEENIAVHFVENAYEQLRSEILSVCCRKSFRDELFASRESIGMRIDRAISSGVGENVIDSMIRNSSKLICKTTMIYESPPFPTDRSSSYSEATLRDTILPVLRSEMSFPRKNKTELANLKATIDAEAYGAAIRQFQARVKEMLIRYKLGYSIMDDIPRYSKIVNSRKRSFDEKAFKLLNDDISNGFLMF